mmetsp:Transcript_54516/g.165707  ORF Transcript_54516/g.165707 Transcript_54516/m.165707 type:complete len:215 (+) Transcript_54516:542-1186(+)
MTDHGLALTTFAPVGSAFQCIPNSGLDSGKSASMQKSEDSGYLDKSRAMTLNGFTGKANGDTKMNFTSPPTSPAYAMYWTACCSNAIIGESPPSSTTVGTIEKDCRPEAASRSAHLSASLQWAQASQEPGGAELKKAFQTSACGKSPSIEKRKCSCMFEDGCAVRPKAPHCLPVGPLSAPGARPFATATYPGRWRLQHKNGPGQCGSPAKCFVA